MAGKARNWWLRQGYRNDRPVHGGTEMYERGTDDSRARVLEERAEDTDGPVRISVAPTKSSNPGRPRTTAMGYDYGSDRLRVVFREGAVYDYFDVSTAQWWRIKRSASPGRFIDRVLSEHDYTRIE